MLRIHEAIQFLDQQGTFCAERAKAETTQSLVLKYGILADIYYTLAATIQIATTPQTAETMSNSIGEALDGIDKELQS